MLLHSEETISKYKIKEIMYIHILNLLCNVIPLWPKRKLKSAVIFIYFFEFNVLCVCSQPMYSSITMNQGVEILLIIIFPLFKVCLVG